MVRRLSTGAGEPGVQTVMDVLNDSECRAIIKALDEPKSATQVAGECGIPTTTAYRKLDRLTDASILAERVKLRKDGHHTTTYTVDFEEIHVGFDEEQAFTMDIDRPDRSADEQLANLWDTVRDEV